jgi:hypothetical protein
MPVRPDLNLPSELSKRLSPLGQRIATDILAAEANEDRVVVTRKEAARMLGIRLTRLINLERTGVLRSYLDGVNRKITTTSVYARMLASVLASHPAIGEPAKRPAPKRQGCTAKRLTPAPAHGAATLKRQRELSVVKP